MNDDSTDSTRKTIETPPPVNVESWPEGDPFFAPNVNRYDVELVASYTGLQCSVFTEHGTEHVNVAMQGWPADKYASLDAALWRWLGTNERRAAFARFAVLVPSELQRRVRVWTGVIEWE